MCCGPLPSLAHKEFVLVGILDSLAGSARHSVERVFGYDELDVHLVCEPLGESAQKGSASGKIDSVFYYVGVQLWRGELEHVQDGGLDFGY